MNDLRASGLDADDMIRDYGFKIRLEHSIKGKDGREMKYFSPAGSGINVFIPQAARLYLEREPRSSMFITEGEKKAIKATREGLPTIAIPGIWMWKDKAKSPLLNPAITEFLGEPRDIFLIFDSDATDEKKRLMFDLAAKGLAAAVAEFDCRLFRVDLPEIGDKTGLDDWFVKGRTKDELADFIKRKKSLLTIAETDFAALVESQKIREKTRRQAKRELDAEETEKTKRIAEEKYDEDIRDIEAATLKTLEDRPPIAKPLFTLVGAKVATRQNLVMIQALPGAGKTAVVGAMIAATMDPKNDCLGFASSNPKGKAIIHIDTEQSDEDHYEVIDAAVKRRAGLPDIPPWFKTIKAIPWDIPDRYRKTLRSIEHYGRKFGGVHSVFIDGVADLIFDPNDQKEANLIAGELHQAAMKYDCAIICVLHENPGKDNADHGKTRGHLGSQLHRKVFASIRLTAKDGITTMSLKKGRRAAIAEKNGPRFMWSSLHERHISTETKAAEQAREQVERDRDLVAAVIAEGEILTTAIIKKKIAEVAGVGMEMAKKRLNHLSR